MTGLTDAERNDLVDLIAEARDRAPRLPDDADSWDVLDAIAPTIETLIARHVQAALTDAADDLRTNAARAWGGDLNWFTTGAHAANLAAEWVESA